ncbi:ABC transporter ATP-binding protein [Oryctes borbonicus]|uniref:ABC transporter ATP-binding protein n=1 Tax=Oryctes borbonicus TaxID=1629725 RepID=A0A0T6BDH0_9SCAR|nr:ABC transporter ATP-binding protein [Oryctes borbonicus]
MEDKINTFVTELSGGMKRKLSLGIALMGNPKILILDEPTAGVDVEGRREIWDLILSFKSEKTVFISTHFLEEAEYLSDYIAIMDCAKLICFGTPMKLKKEYEIGYKCVISYADPTKLPTLETLLNKTAPSASIVKKENDVVLCRFHVNSRKSEIANLLAELDEKKEELAITYRLSCSTLEDLYLKVQDEKGIIRKKLERKLKIYDINIF